LFLSVFVQTTVSRLQANGQAVSIGGNLLDEKREFSFQENDRNTLEEVIVFF